MMTLRDWAKENKVGYKTALKMANAGEIEGCHKPQNRWLIEDPIDLARAAHILSTPTPRSVIGDLLYTVGSQAAKCKFIAMRREEDPDYAEKVPFSTSDMKTVEGMSATIKRINVELERLDRQDILNELSDEEVVALFAKYQAKAK